MAEILQGFGGTAEQASRAVALLKSLSHEGRLQILCLLVEGELNVTQLAEALVVQPRREGKSVYYHLARKEVATVVTALRDSFCKSH